MTALTSITRLLGVPLLIACSIPSGLVMAQTFTVLHTFTATEGSAPNGLVLRTNTIYGTTQDGTNHFPGGTVFAMNTSATEFTNLYVYTGGTDGFKLNSGLFISDNTLFATARFGGTEGDGTIFALNVASTQFTNIHNFNNRMSNEGLNPSAGLLLSGSTLYGSCSYSYDSVYGILFAVSIDGSSFTNLHSFSGFDGAIDLFLAGELILSGNTLYGTASHGGSSSSGTVFALNTNGSDFRVLHHFTGLSNGYSGTNTDGGYPYAALILSSNTLFGTASYGGTSGVGTVFALNTDGTCFTTLHNFSGGSDGAYPTTLILSGETLYGIAHGINVGGSTSNIGTVFKVNTDGTAFTTLYKFTPVPPTSPYTNNDGANPSSLILSSNTLYGTTTYGGTYGNGTVFSIFIQPQLTIIPSEANVVLRWPTNYPEFNLQSTTNLVSPVWTTVSQSPVTLEGRSTVTNAISGVHQFFRLSK